MSFKNIRPDNIQPDIPFLLNKDIDNYEIVINFLLNCFIKSFDDEDIILDKKTILNIDNLFFIVDVNNNILAFVDIEINNNIVKIDNLCNNIKYEIIILTYIFNHFNDDLINSKKIIKLSPIYEVLPYYLNFKYPNFPLLDDNYNNCREIIWYSTNDGEILYGNSDIITEYLLESNYNEFLRLLDDKKISYNKDELNTKKINWFRDVMIKILKNNEELDDGDKEVIITYIRKILKYTPVSIPKIDNYIPITIQQDKNIKLNFIINNKIKNKINYNYLSKIKRKKHLLTNK